MSYPGKGMTLKAYIINAYLIFSPNSVDTLRGSYGSCEAPVLDRGVARSGPAISLLFTSIYGTFTPLKIVDVYCGGCLSRLRSRCGAVHIFGHGGHFSWQAQGKPRVLVVLPARTFTPYSTSCSRPKSRRPAY